MNTKEKARDQAGQVTVCATDDSTLTAEQSWLLAELQAVQELRDQYQRRHLSAVGGLNLARLRLLAELRATGWRELSQQGGAE